MPPQLWWHQGRAASSSLPHPPFAALAGLHDTTGVPEQVLPAVYLGGDNVFITIPAKPNVTAPGAVLLEETDIPEYHMPGGVAARMGWWGHRRSRAGLQAEAARGECNSSFCKSHKPLPRPLVACRAALGELKGLWHHVMSC